MGKRKRARGALSWDAYHHDQLMAQQAQQLALMRQMAANQPDAHGGRWAPDPHGRFHSRYWDGERWTEWVGSASGERSSDPLV